MKTHLEMLRAILTAQATNTPWGDWALDRSYYPDEARVLTMGCTDGVGAYTQFTFDDAGLVVKAEVINPNGRTCDCGWCKNPEPDFKPHKKTKKKPAKKTKKVKKAK